MKFKQLGLCKNITDACKDKGYEKPTKIQQEGIIHLLRKRDLLAIAKTGTGKTATFVLPMLQDIYEIQQKNPNQNRVLTKLIIAPTRELVLQLEQSIKQYAKYLDIKICSVSYIS